MGADGSTQWEDIGWEGNRAQHGSLGSTQISGGGGRGRRGERKAVEAEEEDQTRAVPSKSVEKRGRDAKESQTMSI